MLLSQRLSNVLFSIIRTAVQFSSIFLLSRIASRSYNITHQERIKSGVSDRFKYIFLTKFPRGRKQRLGRFYVALALIVSLALNYLSTLLSALYPVSITFRGDTAHNLEISTAFMKTTELQPNKTSVEEILNRIGVDLNGRQFGHYTTTFPQPVPCKRIGVKQNVNCTFEIARIGLLYNTTWSFVVGARIVDGSQSPINATTPDGGQFQYFNTSIIGDDFTLVRMFTNLGEANAGDFQDMLLPSPRSLESCLLMHDRTHRCVRHSLGYLLSSKFQAMLITRRVFVQTIFHNFELLYETDEERFQPNETIAGLDCNRFPTATLTTMCTQLRSLGSPYSDRVHSIQQLVKDPDGSFHWDVIMFSVEVTTPNVTYTHLVAQAFHLDASIKAYNTSFDFLEAVKTIPYDNRLGVQFIGRETFEATNILNASAVPIYDRSWINWGFSDADMHNLTDFLLRGTLLNNGVFVMRSPELLADIPNLVIALFFVVSAIMVIVGKIISIGVDPMVHKPITEILPQLVEKMRGDGPGEDGKAKFHENCVANLTLVASKSSNHHGR
ncbi:hypothetical protein BGW38_007238 [Lunasporangiospora selenospora]|uniref:Uncharacterized protein n=1 Tax=Lunasporangiospora selenospora TaxID=979761 RepID=A0A9P6FZ01_9FUNG|nr:hypothetical protein BGW38_007238 [Lunasporangiospora selenospora]